MIEWLNSHALLWQPGFAGLDPGHRPTRHSSSRAVAAAHTEELEGLIMGCTTMYWGFGEEKKKEGGRLALATDVSSGLISPHQKSKQNKKPTANQYSPTN